MSKNNSNTPLIKFFESTTPRNISENNIPYLNKWLNFKEKAQIQKIIKFNVNFSSYKRLGGARDQNTVLTNPSLLIFNFQKQFKLSYKQILFPKTLSTSIGVVLKVLKVLEKRERKLEKNKSLFLSYVLRYLIKGNSVSYLTCKYFTLSLVTFLRKFSFFRKLTVQNIIFYISSHPLTLKRVRRIKRRLKKRLLKYENTH